MNCTTTKEVTEIKEITDHIRCDVCGRLLDMETTGFPERNKIPYSKLIRVIYHKVHVYHNDWGNDSVESHKSFDICPTHLHDVFIGFNKYPSDTKNLEIETTTGISVKDPAEVPEIQLDPNPTLHNLAEDLFS